MTQIIIVIIVNCNCKEWQPPNFKIIVSVDVVLSWFASTAKPIKARPPSNGAYSEGFGTSAIGSIWNAITRLCRGVRSAIP